MKSFITAVLSFGIAGALFNFQGQSEPILWWQVLRDFGVTAGLFVSIGAGIWKSFVFFIERHDRLKKERETLHTLTALKAKKHVPAILDNLAEKLKACKVVEYKANNGALLLSGTENFKVTVLHENIFIKYSENPKALKHIRGQYQGRLVYNGFGGQMNDLRLEKIALVDDTRIKSEPIVDMWKAQGIKCSIMVWIGALPGKFIYLSFPYQTMRGDLTAEERHEIGAALDRIRDLYEMDYKQFERR